MHTDKLSLVYTTIDSLENAQKLAYAAIENKFAICANIFPAGLSIYPWEKSIQKSPEYYILFKTDPVQLNELERYIQTHHPYKTPAIISMEARANLEFLNYTKSNLGLL